MPNALKLQLRCAVIFRPTSFGLARCTARGTRSSRRRSPTATSPARWSSAAPSASQCWVRCNSWSTLDSGGFSTSFRGARGSNLPCHCIGTASGYALTTYRHSDTSRWGRGLSPFSPPPSLYPPLTPDFLNRLNVKLLCHMPEARQTPSYQILCKWLTSAVLNSSVSLKRPHRTPCAVLHAHGEL